MIEGEFSIYTDKNDKSILWGIFKRKNGDHFLFKQIFDEIISLN